MIISHEPTLIAIVACCVWSSVATSAPPASRPVAALVSAEEAAAGFKPLFNGVDLNGWEPNGKPGSFSVADGCIVGDRRERKDSAYWLSTIRQYGDFELRLQVRIQPKGNSGIFIRAPRDGRTSRMGMEIQILDDGGKAGAPGVGNTGAIYQVLAPKRFAAKLAGEWNELWIRCEGDHVRVTMNGHLVNEARMSDYPALASRPRKGYIGLSAHTDPVQFRNLRLREIPAGATRPASTTNPAK
jgi:hypothetical protein